MQTVQDTQLVQHSQEENWTKEDQKEEEDHGTPWDATGYHGPSQASELQSKAR